MDVTRQQAGEAAATTGETPVIVGTAGHVDHGKSSLVLRMTGTDPDRLPQEKSRGITIDLGFAELDLPSGRIVGLVDVPGHGHYVRAMVAGATGVDVALLVVAADDGVMPQTREHVRILQLLGVRHMVVALTKADLVDEDWLALVQADVEDYLSGTAFAGAHVLPVSSRTGAGVDALMAELDRLVAEVLASGVVERRLGQPARLPIDRSFNVAGIGAVVTGTTRAGAFAPQDAVEIYPSGVRARVRSVQVHGHDVPLAQAGQRTALNLTGVSLEDLPRGCTVAAPGSLGSCDRFDATLTWLGRDGHEKSLASGDRVHVCTGTSQVLGRVLLFDGAGELACGQMAQVQVRIEEPLALRPHDRFVVMAYSPVELVGGGEVLIANPQRRTTLDAGAHELLDAIAAGNDEAAVRAYVRGRELPVTAGELASRLGVAPSVCTRVLGQMVADGSAVELRGRAGGDAGVLDPSVVDEVVRRCVAHLTDACAAEDAQGVPIFTLRDAVCPRMGDDAFAAIAGIAQARGSVASFGSNLVPADRLEALAAWERSLEDGLLATMARLGVASPFDEELAAAAGMSVANVRRALAGLQGRGLVEEVAPTYHLPADAYRDARERVAEAIRAAGGTATASDLREALGLSRKYALPVLEHLDKAGFTTRDREDPNLRRLVEG